MRNSRRVAIAAVAALAFLASVALLVPGLSANTLNTTIRANILALYKGTSNISGITPSFEVGSAQEPDVVLATGYGTNQADMVFADRRSISASSSETLDLYGGLTDAFGATLNFARVKAILIKASSANTNSVVIGNAGSNPFLAGFGGTTPNWTVPPGGQFLASAPASGWTITNSSNDNLKIANSGGTTSVTYDIIIVGASQ